MLRLSEAMTAVPANVPDEIFDALRSYFNEAQLVELAAAVALENFRARFNRALKIESEGFCELPPDHPVRKAR